MSYQDDVASILRNLRSIHQDFLSIRRDFIIIRWTLAATIIVELVILVMLP